MMPENRQHEATEPSAPFRRPMQVAAMSRHNETQFRVAAEPDELAALAEYLGVLRVDRLTLAGFISPEEDDGWRVRGRLVARVDQACGVTLVPLHARHESEVERLYVPAEHLVEGPEIRVFHDEHDTPDPYLDSIDPGELAVETLALLIEPYPRAEGAELDGRYEAPNLADSELETKRPFAALAALKKQHGGDTD